MRIRVFVYAALFAFAPLISFFAGALYFMVVKVVLMHPCKEYQIDPVCRPGHLLTLSGFMPAVMIFTLPTAALFVVIYVIRAYIKSRRVSETGPGKS